MPLDATANFVRGETDSSTDSIQTTVSVVDASIFPDPATEGEYNVVIWDVADYPRPDQDPDVEILRVTATDTTDDDLTVTRGQEGTSSASHPLGSAVHLSPTAKMFGDIESTFNEFYDDGAQELTADVNNTSVSTGQVNDLIKVRQSDDLVSKIEANGGKTIHISPANHTVSESVGVEVGTTIIAYGAAISSSGDITPIQINKDNVSIYGGVYDGSSQTDGDSSLHVIEVGNANNATIKDVEVKNGGYYGVNLFESNNCKLLNSESHDNHRHGLHLGTDTAGKGENNKLGSLELYNNGVDGISDRGTTASGGNPDNIYSDITAYGNGAAGVRLTTQSSASVDSTLRDSDIYNNNVGFVPSGNVSIVVDSLTVEDNNNSGVDSGSVSGEAPSIKLDGVVARGNGSTGVNLGDFDSAKLASIEANNNGANGISLSGNGGVDCTQIEASDNTSSGILTDGVPEFSGQNIKTVDNSGTFGIVFQNQDPARIVLSLGKSTGNFEDLKVDTQNTDLILKNFELGSFNKSSATFNSIAIEDVVGYQTDNDGNASVADGGTITHGLSETPNIQDVNVSTASSNRAYVSSTDAADITVGLEDPSGASVGTAESVYWSASILQ